MQAVRITIQRGAYIVQCQSGRNSSPFATLIAPRNRPILVLYSQYSTSSTSSARVLATADLTVTQDESGMRLDRFLRHRLNQDDRFPVVNNILINKWLRKRQVKLLVHSEVSTTDKAEDRAESKIENVIGPNTSDYKTKTVTSATTRTETGQIWRVRTIVEKGHNHQSTQDSKATIGHGSTTGIEGPVDTSSPAPHLMGQSRAHKDLLPLQDWILYMDDKIVVLNKPAGIAVQDGTGIETSIDSSLQVLQDAHGQKPRLVHRLDKTTSGVLILARTRKAAQELSNRFHDGTIHSKQDNTRARAIEKKYVAIVGSNEPLLNTATNHLARLQADMAVLTRGKQQRIQVLHQNSEHESGTILRSITDYRILDQRHHEGTHWSLLELYPRTGRKHQLRVHCAQVLKAPILGDLKYAGAVGWTNDNRQTRLCLHMAEVVLQEWLKDENDKSTVDSLKDWDVSKNGALTIRARIPTDMAQEMHRLRLRV